MQQNHIYYISRIEKNLGETFAWDSTRHEILKETKNKGLFMLSEVIACHCSFTNGKVEQAGVVVEVSELM